MATLNERVVAAIKSIRDDQKRQADKIREIIERESGNVSEETAADLEGLAKDMDTAADTLTGIDDDATAEENAG